MLSCGLSFHETNALDTGIDGYIELRDPDTGEVKAQYIAAQIKTRESGPFSEETAESFSLTCERRDLDYRMSANTPVVLVVVRLSDRATFWKSIRTWFDDTERRRTRKVWFDKRQDVLNETTVSAFAALVASFARPGFVVPSMRTKEQLDHNLLKAVYPEHVHAASTSLAYSEIRQALVETYGNPPNDWILNGKKIWSFRDLSVPPFREVIDEGTEEPIGTREWYLSEPEVTKRQFVDLLRRTLSEMLHEPLIYWRSKGYLFFKRRRGKDSQTHSYKSFRKRTSRDVVKGYGKAGERPSYYRHAAFYPNFVELGGEWYLAIEPTYHFTSDGYHEFSYAAERLSGIKRLETNQSVRGHVGMWKSFLVREPDFLRADLLQFEDVSPATIFFGVPDDLWRRNENDEEKDRVGKAQHELFV